MQTTPEYTGINKVVLPSGYLDSIEAACDFYQDEIAAVAANLDYPGLRLTRIQKALRQILAGLAVWLLPVCWLTCR